MPIYDFSCGRCGKKVEAIQSFEKASPICCGESMVRLPTYPAKISIKGEGGVNIHSEGYKKGYAENYRRRLQEAKS